MPLVFEKGYTGHNGRIDKRASGLGLYLCQMVAQKLNIELTLASKIDQGTRVTLLFPEKIIF